jgi:hypothetical protein
MAAELIELYRGQQPLFVCLLRGGAPFAARLMFAVTKLDPTFHPELDYMTVRTSASERSASHPELVMGLAPGTDVMDRTVVMLDDVLDKGHTAGFTSGYLRLLGAAQVDPPLTSGSRAWAWTTCASPEKRTAGWAGSPSPTASRPRGGVFRNRVAPSIQ